MRFSVIIPVYNREHVISTCVEGILNTSFKDFEILLVDDGSTDNSLNICLGLADKYAKVKVISQKNAGVSSARNAGLKIAQGEYILFSDSDDTYSPNALSEIDVLLNDDVDLLMFQLRCIHYKSNGLIFPPKKTAFSKKIDGNVDILSWIFGEFDPYTHPFFNVVTKAYKKSIIEKHKILFNENLSLGEDQVFTCDYLHYVASLLYVDNPFYNIIQWPISKRTWGLGSVFRSSEDFINNQIVNYQSLINLYHHCKVNSVKTFAVNYILDRPISRVIFRNSLLSNSKRATYQELKCFTNDRIKPVLEWEYENRSCLRDKSMIKYVEWVMQGRFLKLMTYSYIGQNLLNLKLCIRQFLSHIKHSVFE